MAEAPNATPKKKPASASERFGAKLNPFSTKTIGQVSRTADFRRISTLPRRHRWADQSEALTLAFAKPALPPNTCPPRCPCNQTGYMRLRPQQAWALSEFLASRGGIGLLGPGSGKTLLSTVLPSLMDWKRPVLFVPAGLRAKTIEIDYPLLSRHWYLPPLEGPGNLEIRSYEELSRDTFADYLIERRIPDGIMADECHFLKNRGSGRSKRLSRFMAAYPETEFCGFSGTVVHRSAMDYGHLFNFALKDNSPLPHSFLELKTWADVLDESVPEYARPKAGALMDFCRAGESVRDGYRRRVLDTRGIVSSPDLSTSIGLNITEIPHPLIPKVITEAFHRLRNTLELPGGEVATTALDQIRHARELFLGFYLRWVWPDGKVDREWLTKRRAWRSYVRKMTTRSHKGIWLDTEAQVAKAVASGIVACSEDEKTAMGKVLRSNVNVYEEWVNCREDRKRLWNGKKEPPKEVVWLSDYMLVELERWAKENTGIVWVENIGFMEKLRERGNVCFGAGENDIEKETGERSVFASFAHATGKNLQIWRRMCFSNPLSSGKAAEQALAREHRPGCKYYDKKTKRMEIADDVHADVYLGCRETWWSFERSRLDARYIESTLGQPQRLNMATIVATQESVIIARCDNGDPLWAETGHAKIDGKVGAIIGVDAEGNDIRATTRTPILTALREEAKRERALTAPRKEVEEEVLVEQDEESADESEDDESDEEFDL